MGDDNDSGNSEKKKRKLYLDVPSSPMANNSLQSPDNKAVDAAALQYQNQKLVQQLEAKKGEVQALEGKFKELKEKQISYDETLITVNKLWNQLVDDLVFLELRLGVDPAILEVLNTEERTRDVIPPCPPEETFLHRLLGSYHAESIQPDGFVAYGQNALVSRHSSTVDLMKRIEEAVDVQRAKTESLANILQGKPSSEDIIIQLQKIDDSLREEVNNLHKAVDFLNLKHKQYADEIQAYLDDHLKDQSEINKLSGQLEESMAELEESRRKLVNLNMQRERMSKVHVPTLIIANGSSSPDKTVDRTMGLWELKISVEEAKILAAARLSELQEVEEDNLVLSKQLEDLQEELKDEKYVMSSKAYKVLHDQFQRLNMEHERYKAFIDSLQADRNHILHKEKDLTTKADLADAARAACSNANTEIKELELQLQKCTLEKNDIEFRLEEALEDAGRKDVKDEICVMASALSKEMEMMEAQLNRCKEAAFEANSLREEAHALEVILQEKTSEHRGLSDRCAEQSAQIKSLKTLIEKLELEKKELAAILDRHGQECFDNRTIVEIKESEHRAEAQAEALESALNEHSLELRVKAANEAEAACQHRLSAAEAEIDDLRTKLDISERDVLELTEAIRVKDAEADAYISEIEAIGQAYEDMQVQNQHLLQQLAERDECNIKLVSDSVRMKQAHSCLLSEKQAMAKQLQQVNTSVEYFRSKFARAEDQVKTLLNQALKASSENRHVAISMDKAKLELVVAEKEHKWLISAVDSYEREYQQNQQQIASMQSELEIERNEKKKLEEELAEVKAEVDEMSAENRECTIQKLQDEIKECKAILKCGVCFDRPKEVVITKCFHLFCSSCIQRNLETRHRRCPGCGTAFGQNDVREVNI